METKPLVTISGLPGSGTTTLAEQLSEKRDYEHVSGGTIFRKLAEEKHMSLAELTRVADENEDVDKELDSRLESIIKQHSESDRVPNGEGLIVESRLSGWHGKNHADISVWLTAPIETRLERVDGRDETLEEMKERDKSERERYYRYYGVRITDTDHYDVIIDTSEVGVDEMVSCIDSIVDYYE